MSQLKELPPFRSRGRGFPGDTRSCEFGAQIGEERDPDQRGPSLDQIAGEEDIIRFPGD
jgi:hypothetical protein